MKKLNLILIIVFLILFNSCSQIPQTNIHINGELDNIESLVATPENIQDFCDYTKQLKNCENCELTMEEWCVQ